MDKINGPLADENLYACQGLLHPVEHYQDLFDVDGNYIGQNKLKANKKGGRSL